MNRYIPDILRTYAGNFPPVSQDVDIVFTLGKDSCYGDWEELKIALRSIEKHAKGVRHVWLATETPPPWVKNIGILHVGDPITNNKDGNLILKLLFASACPAVSDRFIFWSDDQALTRDIDLRYLIPSYNDRGPGSFKKPQGKWQVRMVHTFNAVCSRKGPMDHNWDSHAPQPIDKKTFLQIMSAKDLLDDPGVCINTAYFGILGEPAVVNQNMIKNTFEKVQPRYCVSRPFIGYKDDTFRCGLKDMLFNLFPDISQYEKTMEDNSDLRVELLDRCKALPEELLNAGKQAEKPSCISVVDRRLDPSAAILLKNSGVTYRYIVDYPHK